MKTSLFAKQVLVFLLAHSASSLPQRAEPDALERKLGSRVEEFTLAEDSLLQALARVAAEFEIPMGIELEKTPQESGRVFLSWRRVTLREILESLVKASPNYRLYVNNGVVHVMPRSALSDKRSFLNLPVRELEVKDEFVGLAARRLALQIRQRVSPRPTPPAGSGEAGSIATGMGDRRVSFKLENVTVRDALDALIGAADFKVWIVTYAADLPPARTGFRRTISVHNEQIPEDQQPVWDLLLWGYDPVRRSMRPDWKPVSSDPAKNQRQE